MSDFLKPNQSYNASLTADYTVGDATLSVNTVPTNYPSIVTVARDTTKETRFTFTGVGSGLLTGVTRLDGANVNIPSGVSVECMIDTEFITQLESAVFDQSGLKGLVYAADGGSTDAYAITLPVAPSDYTDITGLPIAFKANTVNTGAATLNVNSLGAKTIKKKGSSDLADGDIASGQIVLVVYDGTDFQLVTPPSNTSVTQSSAEIYAADAGANDTYVITPSPAFTAYTAGMVINFKANTANTGAATLNVNSLGPKTIKKRHDQDLEDNDIESGQVVTVVYDGTNFQMQSQLANTSVISSKTFSFTHDVSSTGSQVITGIGFTPTSLVVAFGGISSNITHGTGQSDSTKAANSVMITSASISDVADTLIYVSPSGGTNSQATIASYDADGFTLTWTKAGSPTGTLTVKGVAYK